MSIDYSARIAKLRAMMETNDLAWLVVFGNANVRYFGGYEPVIGDCMMILGDDGFKHLLIRFEWDASRVPDVFPAREIEASYDFSHSVKTIMDGKCGKIGAAGLSLMPWALYETLKTSSHDKVVSLDADCIRARLVKEPKEIELLGKAVQITEGAMLDAFRFTKPGVSELEIAAVFEHGCKNRGAAELSFISCVASGENSHHVAWLSSERAIQSNEALFLDVGARYHGYCADVGRTWFTGKPEQSYLNMYKKMQVIQEELLAFIKPGMASIEPYEKVEALFKKNGLGIPRHRLGHGLGIETSMEGPDLKYGNEILEPNMCFAVEISHEGTHQGGIKIEDNVVLREHGVELLTRLPRELQIIQ